jgi:hypothetical protein
MKILGFDIKKSNTPPIQQEQGGSFMGKYPVDYEEYDGEKTDGDLGAPVNYALDYDAMSARAWQHFIDTDFVSIVLERYLEWVIGVGLRLEAKPDIEVIKSEGVTIKEDQVDEFTTIAENRFRLLAGSTISDYRGIDNLHKISVEVIKNAFLSGDCLVIYRIDENGLINTDYVNGQDIKTPIGKDVENRVIQGVEINDKGEHLAYWVQTGTFNYQRVAARDDFGRLRAELVVWKRAKRSDVRGLSALHSVFQKMRNIDRYTEATVQSAVTRANLAYFFTTDKEAVGASILARAQTAKTPDDKDVNFLADLQRKVYADTAKTIHELPPGATIQMPDSKMETNAKEFVSTYFNHFCAAIGIPPEVALQLYTSSFSASRMATKSWEHTLKVKRNYNTIYKNVYRLFIDVQVSMGKIKQPQLKAAISSGNEFLILAFTKSELIGANVPHADPVKEAKAHRELLGNKDIPLETAGKATETLGTGDYDEIVKGRKREMKKEADFINPDKSEVYE